MGRPTRLVAGVVVVVLAVGAMCLGRALAGDVRLGLTVAQASPTAPQGSGPASGGTTPNEPLATAGQEAAGEIESYAYDPSSRRDPFFALVRTGPKRMSKDLPPLQRVGLTEVTLIGIIWGGFGYTAMVRTPDGKGYAVRRGTRIGPSNGVVSKISEREIVVTERFTDTFGRVQEREYIKALHPSEGLE